MKPLKKGFKYIQKQTNIKPENIAVVGDQIFTDVIRWEQKQNVYNTNKANRYQRHMAYENKKTI